MPGYRLKMRLEVITMGLINIMREKIRHFLRVDSSNVNAITIQEKLDYYGNAIKNRIWYRGNSQELSQLYSQLDAPPTMFWKATCTKGLEIRKIHTGLPKLIVNMLTKIVVTDFNGVDIEDQTQNDLWQSISKENKFDKLLKKCIKNMLFIGDGAFKITFDKSVCKDKPIIEFISGENVDFTYKRGRITEIIFVTEYTYDHKRYVLKEYYGKGYIKYKLFNAEGKELPNNYIPQTSWIDCDGFTFDENVMLAVPVVFGESEQFEGRGESVFDGKIDNFDALDEVVSQWMDALRMGRTKERIPECLIPKDPKTGETMKPNAFDNRFIEINTDMSENGSNKIQTDTPNIQHESYLATYITILDLCLQGLISPSTLGIDVKKLDNSEAQREKEKATLYTRNNIIEVLNEIIPDLVISAICGNQIWNKQSVKKPNATVKFGEYANPSFESQVETVTKAKTGGIMSIEAGVDELYGDSKDDTWKADEVKRLKIEQGISVVEEPGVNNDLGSMPINSDATEISMLNGAQISSLMNVIRMVKEKSVTRNEAISIITATLGISRENAESFIEEGVENASQNIQSPMENG